MRVTKKPVKKNLQQPRAQSAAAVRAKSATPVMVTSSTPQPPMILLPKRHSLSEERTMRTPSSILTNLDTAANSLSTLDQTLTINPIESAHHLHRTANKRPKSAAIRNNRKVFAELIERSPLQVNLNECLSFASIKSSATSGGGGGGGGGLSNVGPLLLENNSSRCDTSDEQRASSVCESEIYFGEGPPTTTVSSVESSDRSTVVPDEDDTEHKWSLVISLCDAHGNILSVPGSHDSPAMAVADGSSTERAMKRLRYHHRNSHQQHVSSDESSSQKDADRHRFVLCGFRGV